MNFITNGILFAEMEGMLEICFTSGIYIEIRE